MVFENVAVHLMEKYLSEYIENFDPKKLKIDIWSGNIVLENLYLKANALAELNLPVTITLGYLKTLKLQVPWKNLYSSPTKLTIDGLYVLVIPKAEIEYNAKQAEKEQHEAKMKEVDKIEQLQKDKENLKNANKKEKDNDTFIARLQLQIIQNLELSIHNIHIVYEDRTTKPNHPFAFGITLNNITFQTTNKDWIPTIIKESTPVIHKLGELNALSVYWNTNMKPNSTLPRNEIINNLQSTIAFDYGQPPKDMSYIFQPFNIKTKLIMTMKPREQNFKKPMFYIAVDLGHISLNLTRAQYLDILDLLEFQDQISAKLKYIKYRPKIFNSTRQKWTFAYNAIVDEKIRPRFDCYKWKNIKKHLENCREYRFIFVQQLTGKATNEQKQRAEELEQKLDIFNLTYIRQRAQLEAKKKKEEPTQFFKKFSNLWNKKSTQPDPELDLEKLLSAEEKKNLYESIGYEGEDTSTLAYPKDYIDIDLNVRLNMLDLNIWSKVNEKDEKLRVITRAILPDTEIIFNRRPATSSILFLASLGSFQVFGLGTDTKKSELSNEGRPILINPADQSTNKTKQQKLLHVEFEINPVDKDSGYRIKVISQSIEIKYNAPTINQIKECFEQDSKRSLQGIKQAAYVAYKDVKNQSVNMVKNNLEKIKVLDIHIDLQSSYFILPENGSYYDGCAVMCLDLGHLVLKQNTTKNKEHPDVDDNYTKFQLELSNFQLLYANESENWQIARKQQTSRLHLIKPMTLYVNLYQCIYTNSVHFPVWKISGEIPAINMRISDARLFNIIKHLQTLPLPESKNQSVTNIEHKNNLWDAAPLADITQQTLETIDSMMPLVDENQETEEKILEQMTQIEASFKLSQVELSLEEERDNKDYPFLRISLVSIYAQTSVKTFDLEFQMSLYDFIIYHEQFITKDNHQLRFIAAQHDESQIKDKTNSKPLVMLYFLHTSADNPLFSSSKYNGIENKIRINVNKLMLTMQLEALLSIMKFQDHIMQKMISNASTVQIKNVKKLPEKTIVHKNTKSTIDKFIKSNNLSSTAIVEIEANIEEFYIVIATIDTQMFDVYVQGIKATVHHTINETSVNLALTDLCIYDPYTDARFRKIISQQTGDKELLSVSILLYNYPKKHTKALDDVDCNVKINFCKANIVFLYKHINQIMGFLDTLNITKAAFELALNQADNVYEQVQKLQNQAFKLRLNATLNAPNIIIPINAYSDEALLLDLGKLNLTTKFIDDPNASLIEQQQINIENVLASRIKLNKNNEIHSEIVLLDCPNFKIDINRLLYPENIKTLAPISIDMHLDLIHFRLAKNDYLSILKMLMENFRDETETNVIREQYGYQQEQQKHEEDTLRKAVINKQNESQVSEISEKIKIHAAITKLALTLYLGESNLIDRHEQHLENLKLANVEVDVLEAIFQQYSDKSYKVTANIKDFRLDDLREADQAGPFVHIINRYFTVDPNAYMLNATVKFKPSDETDSMAQQSINAQLESLYICIKLDYLMILKEFFVSNMPIDNQYENDQTGKLTKKFQQKQISPSSSVETAVKLAILIKNPAIILLEDQHNANSYCIVLNFALDTRIVHVGQDTKLFGCITDLTVYSSNFTDLQSSKIKYQILKPAKIDLTLIMNDEQQKIDMRCSHIIVNIMPIAVRILIGVTNSLSKQQTINKQEYFNTQTMFNPKELDEANFWYLKDSLDDMTSQENSLTKNMKKSQKVLIEQLVLSLDTMEIKLDVGFGSVTKSVVALCLSDWSVDVENWSNEMSGSVTINIEAAIYNERTLAWEPLIEPILNETNGSMEPLNVTCSIKPILPISGEFELTTKNGKTEARAVGLNARQLILIQTQQLLNITITKTGLELIKSLSTLFGDIYKQRLPKNVGDDESMLSVVNLTGQTIFIENLNGLEFADNTGCNSSLIEQNQSVPLIASAERSSSVYRLSVIQEQNSKIRQEFSVQFDNYVKLISINRTWQRIYYIKQASNAAYPVQLLCNTQINSNRRRVILSSIVKLYNNTTIPIFIIDAESITGKICQRIDVNESYYVPIDILYKSQNGLIFIGIDEIDQNGLKTDLIALNWTSITTHEQNLKSKDGKNFHFLVHAETKEAYSENTDQLDRMSYNIHINSAIHLTNLLPIDLQCSIVNHNESIHLKPSQIQHVAFGGRNSILIFTIPSYNNIVWVSDPVDLGTKTRNATNEQIVTFRNPSSSNKQDVLRMVLYMSKIHEVWRLSLYAPYWIVNHTSLILEFRIGSDRMFVTNDQQTFLVCPEKHKSDSDEKGQIRLYGITQDDSVKNWSEKFSLDVIKSIGMASCKGLHEKTFMICVNIQTSSFGLTKIITLTPAMVIINKTSIPIEIVETLKDKEQDKWRMIECDKVSPFWPQNPKEGLLQIRYAHNQKTSKPISMNKKHQTLLYMNDADRLVIFVEVIATDFDGVRIIFSDYKQGDAPVLIINNTPNQMISFVQKADTITQYLVPNHFVYYTWMDPLKPRDIIATCNDNSKIIELNPHQDVIGMNENFGAVYYVVFIDGVQTVLLFTHNYQIIEKALNIPMSTQSICRRVQLGIPNAGISIVNDITREEILYISLKRSKTMWVQILKSRVKPFSNTTHTHLEDLYLSHLKSLEIHPNNQSLLYKKYKTPEYREVIFYDNTADLVNQKGERKSAKRKSLDGLWIEYTWSSTNSALYARINYIQIDNQLECTNYPSAFYPIVSKTTDSDMIEKPFIELSIYETKTSQSNIMHFQYCKILIQEFALRIDQGLLLAILTFFRQEKTAMVSMIDMDRDLENIHKTLQSIIKVQTDSPTSETQMYFDNIHLSPLKIHVSFSMHGSKPNEELFAEYPIVGFLLRTLNVAEVKDVILRLGFYDRSFDRFTVTKLQNEVSAHYQNQFFKQIHVLILGLDVLGNPLGIIRGLAEGVESLFYEPYKGAIEGPLEFAEGMATGVLTLVGSTVGTAAGAVSRITGVIGKSLATLTFDEEYKASRIRQKEPAAGAVSDIATSGKNVVMGIFNGVTGVVTKPVAGAKRDGALGFVKGLGKGVIGLVAQPTGSIVDFASTSFDVVKRTATQEHIVRRIRYPRHVNHDGLVRPYIPHEAMGSFVLNRLDDGKYAKTDTYIAHITCSDDPPSWLLATSKRIVFVTEISIIGTYEINWKMNYTDLKEVPSIVPEKQSIQLLSKASTSSRPMGKSIIYRNIYEAGYFIDKVTNAMHSMGL